MASESGSPVAVYSALVANFVIAITKFLASAVTGSSAMFSEGVHSVVDTSNQALILLGLRRSRKPPDARHPFGYGKELYFWSFVVAIILFGFGGGLSFYEGIKHVRHPVTIDNPTWNYVVLSIAFVVESAAWILAYKELRKAEGDTPFFRALRASKNPAVFTVLAEDTAAMLGLLVAFLGVFLGQLLGMPILHGVASIVIGVILCLVAAFLAFESKALLIGESADMETIESVRAIAEADEAVLEVYDPLTMHFSSRQILLNLGVRFVADDGRIDIVSAIKRIERAIKVAHPDIRRIFIEAEGPNELEE